MEAAFARLSPADREIVCEARLLQRPHADIAADLGKSPGAVRVMLHRALLRLGMLMEDHDPATPSG